MKKVVSMIVVLVSSLAISCSNDFINILPTSSVSVDNYIRRIRILKML